MTRWTDGGIAGAAVAAVSSAGLASFAYAGRLVAEAESRFPPIGRFVQVEGLLLHHVSAGRGRPVVLLHGNPGFVWDYALTVMDLLAGDFRVCAIDRPGHGYSGRPTREVPTPEVQARLVRGAVRALGLDRPLLVGHSWSGALILAYALAYPEEVCGLVLLAGVSHPRPPVTPRKNAVLSSRVLGAAIRWTIWPPIARRQVRANLEQAYAPEPVRPDHGDVAEALWSRPGQVRAAAQDFLTVEDSLAGLAPRYGEIDVPVVTVVGEDDPWIDPAVHAGPLAEKVRDARLISLPNTGHEIAHTRPREVARAVREALRT